MVRNCEKTGQNGWIWCEAKSYWVLPTDATHKKRLLRANERHRNQRITDWKERQRLEKEERKAEVHRKMEAESRALRRHKKRQRTGVDELAEDDDAFDYSDREELTVSETEWLNSKENMGY